MAYSSKLKILIFFYHILFVLSFLYIDRYLFALGVLSYLLLSKFGGEIGLHRYFSHRSFSTSSFWDRTLLVCATGNGLGSPISWAGTHRLHHRFSDEPGDPHSPRYQSPWRVWLTLWRPFIIPSSTVKDLMRDPGQRFVHKNYFLIHISAIAVLAILDWRLPGIVLAWPCVLGFNLSGAVNVLCHRQELRDHRLLNFVGLGDALHKSHHRNPSSYANNSDGDFDLSALIIRRVLKVH